MQQLRLDMLGISTSYIIKRASYAAAIAATPYVCERVARFGLKHFLELEEGTALKVTSAAAAFTSTLLATRKILQAAKWATSWRQTVCVSAASYVASKVLPRMIFGPTVGSFITSLLGR